MKFYVHNLSQLYLKRRIEKKGNCFHQESVISSEKYMK